MKLPADRKMQMTSYTLLFVLLAAPTSAVSSVAQHTSKKWPPIGFDIDHSQEPVLLRGSSSEVSHTSAAGNLRRQPKPSMMALQTSEQAVTSAKRSRHKRAFHFSALLKQLRTQASHKKAVTSTKVDLCDGERYQWIVDIREQCKESYGEESTWDQSLSDGACEEAWDECNSRFANDCCTQPEGPRNMDAYCERERSRDRGEERDRACDVQGEMSGMQQSMQGIQDEVGAMNTAAPPAAPPTQFQVMSGDCKIADGGRCVVSPGFPDEYTDEAACEIRGPSQGIVYPRFEIVSVVFHTESCCDKLSVGKNVYSGEVIEDGPEQELEAGGPNMLTWTTDFSTPDVGWKVCVQDIPPSAPPPPVVQPQIPQWWGPGPAPAWYQPPMGILGAPSPALPPRIPHHAIYRHGPRKPTKLEAQCAKLTGLVQKVAHQVDSVKKWAKRDGIEAEPEEQPAPVAFLAAPARISFFQRTLAHFTRKSKLFAGGEQISEAKDPDLVFAMRKVLNIGKQLDALRHSAFCSAKKRPPLGDDDDDDDDDDEDDALDDGPAPAPAPIGVAGARARAEAEDRADGGKAETAAEKEEEEDEEEAKEEEEEEETKVNSTAVVALLEWEYGMKEVVGKFEGEVHPHGRKWWRYRYEYTLVESFVLAFDVMLLYGIMWLLHGVSFFHKFKFYHIGLTSRLYRYAWAYLVFHGAALMILVTITYALYFPWGEGNIYDYCAEKLHKMVDGRANVPYMGYSWLRLMMDVCVQLFVCFAIYALFIVFVTHNFQRALDDWKRISDTGQVIGSKAVNAEMYTSINETLKMRVQRTRSLQRAFVQMKLRVPDVVGPENLSEQDWNDFKMHLYLTNALGKALEYMVEVSFRTNCILALSALFVAVLAHHYQVAFMYFLPIFIIGGFIGFLVCFMLANHLRTRSRDHNYDEPLQFLTVHAYCRSVQIVLYCVFFSFSRLLLSNDIFSDYPKVYLAAVIGLLVTLLGAWLLAGEIIKETLTAIVLPPQISEDRFKKSLQEIVYWFTAKNCHECGVRQMPRGMCLNQEWAGSVATREPEAPDSARSHKGPLSWR